MKNPETLIQKNLYTPMFIAVLFTIAKCWKEPKCPSVFEWIKKPVVLLHNGILCSRKKEGTPTFCNSMGLNGEYCSKGSKPVSERQIPHAFTDKRLITVI